MWELWGGMRKCVRTRALFSWQGGKSRLATTIIARLPNDGGLCYVELFAGAGHVFFRKEPSASEVLNDINGELINLYRVVQHHLEAFRGCLGWALNSREAFEQIRDAGTANLTDIQRAVRYYYLLRHAFANAPRAFNFGYHVTQKGSATLPAGDLLEKVHQRLQRVIIERLDFEDVIRRYDRPHTIFYADPPYLGLAGYGLKFTIADHKRLAEAFRAIKGRFLLSCNDHPEMRALYDGFEIEEVLATYSVSRVKTTTTGKPRPKNAELLIRNY